MLTDFKRVKNLVVVLLTLNKSYFSTVKTVRICVSVKTSKVLIFFCWKHCDMNNFLTESWILINSKIVNTIYHDNILKLLKLQEAASKTSLINELMIIFHDGWLLQVNYKRTGWLLFQINFDVYLKRSFVESVLSSTF